MFSVDGVTLRPLDASDLATIYAWETDIGLNMTGGWVRQQSRAAFTRLWERRIEEPKDDMDWFAIEHEGKLAGYIQLALIDREERRAMVGIVVGEKALWGKGVGSTALRLLVDYAFTVRCLERVYAEVYTFNTRSMRMFERVGFQREGTLRQSVIKDGRVLDQFLYAFVRDDLDARP